MQTSIFQPYSRLRLITGLLLIICGVLNLSSQTYYFDNYSTQQGFESKVYSIIQDNEQYVWLGTPTGVSEFDGKNFFTYDKTKGLADGGARVLFIDNRQILWVGHEGGGISRRIGKKFEKISFPDSILRSNITSINQDANNHLWITTESDGAFRIKNPEDPASLLEYEHYLKGESLGDRVFKSFLTADSTLYFITNVGIRIYN